MDMDHSESENVVVTQNGSEPRDLSLHWNKNVVFGCLFDIKKSLTLATNVGETDDCTMPKNLARSFMTIIGEVDLLTAKRCVYKRVINQMVLQFVNGSDILKVTAGKDIQVHTIPSDLENDLQFRPTECFADKITQILGLLCIAELESAKEELANLHYMRESPFFILWNPQLDEAYSFVEKIFEGFLDWVTGEEPGDNFQGEVQLPAVTELSVKSQLVLKVVRAQLLRNFRFKQAERVEMMKEVVADDGSQAEWLVTVYEAVRRKRDGPKYLRGGKQAGDMEEHTYVDRALKLDDQNPFVRLALFDCIINCLRDSRQSFTCGGVTFHTNSNQIIAFMKQSCREILSEFPRSVKLHSRISDYFARFVTLNFFDVAYSEECLDIAYKLNPTYPPTTHRLGIFYRMSKGALSTSFEWFRKTENLDPYHYNAFLECVKNMIGHPEQFRVAEIIEEKLWTSGACSWTDTEILELLFYKGIAHFARKEMEKALDAWALVAIHSQTHFRLIELDQVCGFYHWDMGTISSDKLRLWVHQENLREDQSPRRKLLVNRLYNLMTGKVMAEKTKYSSKPLGCASIFRYFKTNEQDAEETH